jgi:hypothetical protein
VVTSPVFYYTLMMPFYEALALFGGIATVVYTDRQVDSQDRGPPQARRQCDTGEYTPTDEYGHPLPS